MSATVSFGIRDSGYHRIVSVIASFDTEGNVRPLYARIGSESFKIESYYLKISYHNSKVFQCYVLDNQTRKPLELTYHTTEMLWSIPSYIKIREDG